MMKRATAALSVVVLATAMGAFTGAALAGNGHGDGNANGNGNANANGHGNGNERSADAPAVDPAAAVVVEPALSATPSPGHSGNAPGQEKKAVSPAAAPGPGQAKKSAEADHGKPSSQVAPASPGVKPSSTTAKNTDAPAASNRTKLYGNGKTAGQIAMQHGYPANGNLHGPGNSQPHKVTSCGHRHGVDVHALKSHRPGGRCGSNVPLRRLRHLSGQLDRDDSGESEPFVPRRPGCAPGPRCRGTNRPRPRRRAPHGRRRRAGDVAVHGLPALGAHRDRARAHRRGPRAPGAGQGAPNASSSVAKSIRLRSASVGDDVHADQGVVRCLPASPFSPLPL